MNIALYISALTLGFLGSFHCAGMCGPIAVMLPKKSGTQSGIFFGRLLYNSGRVFTYVLIGILFGVIGLSIAMKGFQSELSVATGVIIIVTVILTSGQKGKMKIYNTTASYTLPLKLRLKKLFAKQSYISLFFIGALNGLLPCGFVYLAAAGSASTGSVSGAMLYMLLFGLGTFPMMMMISLAANYVGLRFKKIFSKVSPFIAIALALLLIQRGSMAKTEACCDTAKPCTSTVMMP